MFANSHADDLIPFLFFSFFLLFSSKFITKKFSQNADLLNKIKTLRKSGDGRRLGDNEQIITHLVDVRLNYF